MTTAYKPPVTALAFLAELWNAEVRVNPEIPRVACDQCDLRGAMTTARVHANPADESTSTAVTDCCLHCIEHVVKAAHANQSDWSKHAVTVELNQGPQS